MPLAPSKWYNQDSGSFLSSHPAVEKIIRLVISVKTHDLTKGNISHQLLSYLLPLILSNFLTLTYNAVDSAIVGRYIGDLALAAGNEQSAHDVFTSFYQWHLPWRKHPYW